MTLPISPSLSPPQANPPVYYLQARAALTLLSKGGAAADLVRQQLAVLHPQELGDLDEGTVERCYQTHAEALTKLCEGPTGAGVSRADALRLLLACQFNGFRSGLYCRLAMINHHCNPNCAKFTPDAGGPAALSEIVAVRDIEPGEEIVISCVAALSFTDPFLTQH